METLTPNPASDFSDVSSARVGSGQPVYNLISDFLIDEAALLDGNRFEEWLALLAPDVRYSIPVRVSKRAADEAKSIDRGTLIFHDDFATLKLRVSRLLDTPSAWAEDPRSRVRRFVSNIAVWNTASASEYAVRSYLQLSRNRLDSPAYHWITAERHDTLRLLSEATLQLVHREVILDAAVLGVPNLAIFL